MCPDHLLTDRAAYISYLESQLEHVTSACMTVASFEERLEAATASTRSLTMKVCLLTITKHHDECAASSLAVSRCCYSLGCLNLHSFVTTCIGEAFSRKQLMQDWTSNC